MQVKLLNYFCTWGYAEQLMYWKEFGRNRACPNCVTGTKLEGFKNPRTFLVRAGHTSDTRSKPYQRKFLTFNGMRSGSDINDVAHTVNQFALTHGSPGFVWRRVTPVTLGFFAGRT